MSYFIKNAAGQCFSDKEGYTPLKYAGVLSESTKSISSITGTPYIAIKDASCPVNCTESVTSYSEAVNLLNVGQIETKYHRCIFVGSLESRSEDYTIAWNPAEQRIDSTLNWKNKTWNYKELFAGDKSIVSYLTNRENGDVLSFKLRDPRSLENYFRPLDSVTYGPDTSDTTDKCLLSNYAESWKGNDDTDAYNELDTDLSASINPIHKKVYYFRQEPETQSPKFGYTFSANLPDINDKGDLSYFTLDLNQIPNNKKHLKLQYFWNILFNSQSLYSDPIAEIQRRFAGQSFTDANGSHMFLYNYHFSNDPTWNTFDSEYKLGHNLSSSIHKDINDNWCADDTVTGTFKTFKNSNPELDYWNDVKTYNRLYVTWANNVNENNYENADLGEVQKIFVNGDYGKKYITTIGCIWVANGENHDTYTMDIEKGTSASIYLNSENCCVLAEANKDIVSGDSFNVDDWTIIDKSLYMVTAHKYNITDGWLSAQNNWGPYSGSFMPYVEAFDNYCHWDYDHTENYSFTAPPNAGFCGTYLWSKKDSPLTNYDSKIRSDVMSMWNGEPWVKDGVVWTINTDTTTHFNMIYISVNVKKDSSNWEYNYPENPKKGYILQRYSDKKFFRMTQDANLRLYVHDYGDADPHYLGDIPWSDYPFPEGYPEWFKCMEEITEEELFDINYSYDDYNLWNINIPPYTYEEFSREKCYDRGTYVSYFGDSYIASVDVMSGYGIDSMAYNESLFSFKNSRNTTNQYKANANSYNYIGHSEYTIDLTNVTERYIHISNPATYLFDSDLGCSGNMNPFVTDFKMTYEAID